MPEERQRVILKLSGELFGENGNHIDFEKYDIVARNLIKIQESSDAEIAIGWVGAIFSVVDKLTLRSTIQRPIRWE